MDDDVLVIRAASLAEDARRVLTFLEARGTFHFPTLTTGLFSAAAGSGAALEVTGYRSVWVRDNVHIAHAHWGWGESDKAVAAMNSVMRFFVAHRHRLDDAISGRTSPHDPMQRPHIRFDGERLAELNEKWSHAQNDALGAFLWLYSKLTSARRLRPTSAESQILAGLVEFLNVIQFWQDEESGHWEEVRKIAASSIGVATAGLISYRDHLSPRNKATVPLSLVNELCQRGLSQLNAILPWECRQDDPTQRRRYDAALLFLIYPYRIVTGPQADQIVSDVTAHLSGEFGVRRYLGDSYWCADYKTKLAADQRTIDFSDNLAERDRLLEPGREAQWCLFDPILALHFGLRHDRTGDAVDRQQQTHHLNRALNQLTHADSRFGPYRCPESYYCERGRYVPNDICPLLWTQANLKLALWQAAGESLGPV